MPQHKAACIILSPGPIPGGITWAAEDVVPKVSFKATLHKILCLPLPLPAATHSLLIWSPFRLIMHMLETLHLHSSYLADYLDRHMLLLEIFAKEKSILMWVLLPCRKTCRLSGRDQGEIGFHSRWEANIPNMQFLKHCTNRNFHFSEFCKAVLHPSNIYKIAYVGVTYAYWWEYHAENYYVWGSCMYREKFTLNCCWIFTRSL